jgi:O-antigen/teichoic acid export membrane protein
MTQEKDLTKRTFSGFLWMITGTGIHAVLKIAVLAILARIVSPVEFGLMGMAMIAVEFSKMFIQMGVGPAIVQRKELEDRHLTTGFTLSLMMGISFSAALALSAPLLADFFRMEGLTSVIRVISLIFLVDSFTLIGQALMQRHMKYKRIAIIEVISFAIGYGAIAIITGYIGWGVWALVAAQLSQAVLQAVLVIIVQPFSIRPGFEMRAGKELLHFGGGFTIAKIGNYIALQGDNLVIGRMLGASALGIYGRAYQFMVMPALLFGNAFDKALFPAMAKVQDEKHRLQRAFLTGLSIIALIAIPLSVVLVLLAPEIVMVVLGPAWTGVILPFQILACGLLFRVSYKISDTLARATGSVYKRAWRQLVYAAVVVGGSYIGQFWGLYGVACGVAVALLVNFLLMTHLSMQLTDSNWSDILKAHWHGIFLGIVTGFISYTVLALCRLYVVSHFWTLTLTLTGIVALLLPAVWCFPRLFIRDEQSELFSKLIAKRPKKIQPQNVFMLNK